MVHFVPSSVTSSFDVPLVSIYDFFDFNYYCVTCDRMPLIPFLATPWVGNFLMILYCLGKGIWVVEIIHCALVVFYLHSIKKGHHSSMKWQHPFSSIYFWRRIIAHKYCLCVSFLTKIIYLKSIAFCFLHRHFLYAWQHLKHMVISSIEKLTPSTKMSGNINSI